MTKVAIWSKAKSLKLTVLHKAKKKNDHMFEKVTNIKAYSKNLVAYRLPQDYLNRQMTYFTVSGPLSYME